MKTNSVFRMRDVFGNIIAALRNQQPTGNKTLIRTRAKDLPDGSMQLIIKMPGPLRSVIVTCYAKPKLFDNQVFLLDIALIELGEIDANNLTVKFETLKKFYCTGVSFDYIAHTDAIYSHLSTGPKINKDKKLIPITKQLPPPKSKVYAGKVISVTAGLLFNGKPVTAPDEIVVEHEKGTIIVKKENLAGYEKADASYFIFISNNGTAAIMNPAKASHYFEMKTYYEALEIA